MKPFDYIVVGAGSAGCVVANRLTEDGSKRVLLLEAGGSDKTALVNIPAGWVKLLYDEKRTWSYYSEPEPELNNRPIHAPRARVMGGCSSINGMVYIRGQRQDYDHWAELGNEGWSYQDVLPYFKRSENCKASGCEMDYHGTGGPLIVDNARFSLPISDHYLAAAQEAGFPLNDDFNGENQEGFGRFHVTQNNGKRHSAAAAFVHPVSDRQNLEIRTEAFATRILFEGKRAVGVEYRNAQGQLEEVRCTGELVLSLGALHTPPLLERSGVGGAEHLAAIGIEQQHELPGVGENLQDHLTVNVAQGIVNAKSIGEEAAGLGIFKHLANYLFKKSGLMTLPAADIAGFACVEDGERPDMQIHFAPAGGEPDATGPAKPLANTITSSSCVLRPESRGDVHINSGDPESAPKIRFNFMSSEYDRKLMIEGIKLQRKIYATEAFAPYLGEEILPGPAVQSDEEILEYIRDYAQTVYHPVGSCKMGIDEQAVVDPKLRVHGLEGLRIADASIFPTLISGNTNAVCIMVGERCADFILKD